MTQIELHKKIDELLVRGVDLTTPDAVKNLISINADAYHYFFAKADENWLLWLWDQGFLNAIKQKQVTPVKFGSSMPELYYLTSMAMRQPKEVTDIILSVAVSSEVFNPAVINNFLNTATLLPAEQLSRLVPKIHDEDWIRLMSVFNNWGFEFEKMFKTLKAAKEYESIILLAEVVLSVRSKDDLKKMAYWDENPFYLKEISYTHVFEFLSDIDESCVERALKALVSILAQVVLLGERNDESTLFPVGDKFPLYDIDFFALKLGENVHYSDRKNISELVAAIKILLERLFKAKENNPVEVLDIYTKYILSLPPSRSIWRFSLFALSILPGIFKDQLKKSFSKIFECFDKNESCYELLLGTEYRKALKSSFGVFDPTYQREYIANIFKYFGRSLQDKSDEHWYKSKGWEILSCISEFLTPDEKKRCKEVFGKESDPSFEPEPAVRELAGGFVAPKGPINKEEFGKLAVEEIVRRLKTVWTPANLLKKNTDNDFLSPFNAEGAGELLRADVGNRLGEYVLKAPLFFEKGELDEHYTYSFLRGIQGSIHSNKSPTENGFSWDGVFELLTKIKEYGEANGFEQRLRDRNNFDTWLSSWTSVHSAMDDVIQELLREENGKSVVDFILYREKFLSLIEYLLSYPDPKPEDEEIETAKSKTKAPDDKEYLVSDPCSIAINSVRGRAYEAYTLFVYQDGKRYTKDDQIKISSDVKGLYEKVLGKENTRALMFMFGRYLPTFYFRDADWINGLLSQIFPEASNKEYLFIAAWEGYLSSNVHEKMFFDPSIQELYYRGLLVSEQDDKGRRYFRDLDEGMANHLSLAFIAFPVRFGFEYPLFKKFWETNIERQAKFISFIGRMFISGRNAQADNLLKTNAISKARLQELWQWLIDTNSESKLFIEFGPWINPKKNIFEISWLAQKIKETLAKTDGALGWDIGLRESIISFAQISPENALDIIRLYILQGCIRQQHNRMFFMTENEWVKAIKILYHNPEMQSKTFMLIDDLIRDGGSAFWQLQDIVNEKFREYGK